MARAPSSKSALATFSADLIDLKPGDYVVHAEHGVAQYLGLREIAQGEAKGDYMLLEYAGGAKLYVPLTRMDLVQRFRGAGEAKPALDRMGGATWTRTKTRIKAKMRDMADELLKLYAARKMAEGFSFSPDSNWQREFEDAFEFTETRDQLTAIKDIKRDMESPQPMDRLLCGDVGYGKTEVVMRAAFKALGDGKQVAVLAPTTVLAFQHFETFKRRFQPFPVRVEMFSRFRSPKELKAALADLAEGKVDIAIGTHRLLSQDVEFRDLGLVIVDEEQRFGVKHKERLKQLKKTVDRGHHERHADPANTTHVVVGAAGHVGDRDAAQGPAGDSHRGGPVSAGTDPLGAWNWNWRAAARSISCTTAWIPSGQRAAMIQELVPERADRRGPRADGRSGTGKDHAAVHAARVRYPGLYYDYRKWARYSAGEHHDRRKCRALWPVGAVSVARAGGPVEPARLRLSAGAAGYGADRDRAQAAGGAEGVQRPGRGVQDRGARSGTARSGQPAGRRAARAHQLRRLRHVCAAAGGDGARVEGRGGGAGDPLGAQPGAGYPHSAGVHSPTKTSACGRTGRLPTRRDAPAREPCRKGTGGPLRPSAGGGANLLAYSALKTMAEQIGIEAVDRRHNLLNVKFHKETRVDPARLMNMVSKTKGAQFTPAGVLLLPLLESDRRAGEGQPGAGEVLRFLSETLGQLKA